MRLAVFAASLGLAAALSIAAPMALAAEPTSAAPQSGPLQISGIYPHLAAFSHNGECGIGAVVPWAGRLWWLTYPPHARHGSDDKLYSIGPDLERTIHPESVGGTHANRLIHRESNQLLIGPYVISADGKVRAFDVKHALVGRMTATARHLTDPANKVYYFDMEGPVLEADVHTLAVHKLFEKPLPGWHGKGGYTAQGRLVLANNGESPAMGDLDRSKIEADLKAKGPEDIGCLGEWDGHEWRVVERRQFVDVTGPGGIRGNAHDSDPLWAMGWDRRSVILKLLDGGRWYNFRVPKGSHCFDPWHGWYTEWPRIREVGGGKYLMVMHGQMFDFPPTFSAANTAGLRPIATHLRYIPDFCDWNGRLVLAADDTTIMANPMAGQSQSNLWFGTWDDLRTFGGTLGWGGPWLGDAVKAGEPSVPYLFAGHAQRVVHLAHDESQPVQFTFETDVDGRGTWRKLATVTVPPEGYAFHIFPANAPGEWIRVRTDRDCRAASCYFHYLPGTWPDGSARQGLFRALATVDGKTPWCGGIIRPAKYNTNLQVLARTVGADGKPGPEKYYEVDESLHVTPVDSPEHAKEVAEIAKVKTEFTVDAASVILTDKAGRRYRLPKGDAAFDTPGPLPRRAIREVVSERTLADICGTFYEIPRGDGKSTKDFLDFRLLKPVTSHNLQITDFCTWRGLLVLAGCRLDAAGDGHCFAAGPAGPALWFGKLDDLWQLGKPVGQGGPWKDTAVEAGKPSDAYLMTNFDRKTLKLSHDQSKAVTFRIEVDYSNRGFWKTYKTMSVPPGETVVHEFPAGYAAHWVRLVADADCRATAWFVYH